jgi:hypothetical protein
LLAVDLGVVLVVAIQVLSRNVLADRLLDTRLALHVQRYRRKGLIARRLEVDIDALDDALRLTLEQPVVGPSHLGVHHLLLELVGQFVVELVYVLLLVEVALIEAEGGEKVACPDRLIILGLLQVEEDLLETVADLVVLLAALLSVIADGRHAVDGVAELPNKEERL